MHAHPRRVHAREWLAADGNGPPFAKERTEVQENMPLVADYCETRVVTAGPTDSLLEVAQRMRDERVGCVVVVSDAATESKRPIGILTDRDIVVGALAQTDRKLHLVMVGDVMSTNPTTAFEDDDLSDTLCRMRAARVRRVPVVRRNHTLVGLLSVDDLIAYIEDEISDVAALVRPERDFELERRTRRLA